MDCYGEEYFKSHNEEFNALRADMLKKDRGLRSILSEIQYNVVCLLFHVNNVEYSVYGDWIMTLPAWP